MNYTRQGIKKQLKSLNSKPEKIKRMILVYLLKFSLIAILALGIFGISAGLGVFNGIVETAPEIELDDLMPNGYATIVYDSDGNRIQKLVAESANRTYVQSPLIPQHLKDAFVAIEDERYYDHNGIDIKGIIRAAYTGIMNGFHFTQGASTITQQLLKNNVFTDWMQEDSFMDRLTRKIQEQYLSLIVSKQYDKDTLLTLYLNTINLGANTLGVQAASLKYFNKSVQELTLSESAVIAGITQNPSRYNPILHPDYNADRRILVLNKMLKLGFCTQEEYDEAMADDVYARIEDVKETTASSSVNSYFIDALTEQVMEDLLAAGCTKNQAYNYLYASGSKIYSTLDSDIQATCDAIFADESNYPSNSKWYLSEYALTVLKKDGTFKHYSVQMLKSYFLEKNKKYNLIYKTTEDAYKDIEEYQLSVLEEGDEVYDERVSITPQPQVSLVIQNQENGHVVAMIGGRGTKSASKTLNRATDSKRQPGSTFKILATYAPALEGGMTLASVQTDAPFKYNDGTMVSNWWDGGTYKGICSMRYAIEQSLNIIAVKTLTIIDPQLGYDYLINFGFTTLCEREVINGEVHSDIIQALSLGGVTYGVTNLELNAAYAAIANEGRYIEPVLYTQFVDANGEVILDNTTPYSAQVIRPTTAFLLTNAMMDVVNIGTGTKAKFDNMAIAGKTGTTSKNNDFWFAGYTPYYTCTIWAGYDNNVSMNTSEEKNFHKTMWRKVMEEIHKDLPMKNFSIPNGIKTVTICTKSGKLPVEGLCNDTLRVEYFEAGSEPYEYCDTHYSGWVCAVNMLPATEDCPFSVPGSILVDPPLHESLIQGSTIIGEDGTIISAPNPTGKCTHSYDFFLDPNSSAILVQQFMMLSPDMQAAVKLHHADAWIGY